MILPEVHRGGGSSDSSALATLLLTILIISNSTVICCVADTALAAGITGCCQVRDLKRKEGCRAR